MSRQPTRFRAAVCLARPRADHLVPGQDLRRAAQLSALITAQLSGETRQLTVDVSGLRFADTASIRTLVLAARTLKERGGSLVLLRPQETMSTVLDLLGAAQMFSIQRSNHDESEPEERAG